MNLQIETIEEKQKVLIVSKKNYSVVDVIKTELKKYGAEVFFSSKKTKSSTEFNYVFLIEKKSTGYKITINHKTVNLNGDCLRKEDVDKILWFSFSKTKEPILNLVLPSLKKTSTDKLKFFFSFSKKQSIFLFICFIFFLHLMFVPPLVISLYYTYRAASSLKTEQFKKVNDYLFFSYPLLNLSKKLYSFSRPTYLLFSLGVITDNLIDIDEKANIALKESVSSSQNLTELEKLIFKKYKTPEDKKFLLLRQEKLKSQLTNIEENLSTLTQKLPSQRIRLAEIVDGIGKLRKILTYSDIILAANTEKKYLLFFANNMELRPGGGFLGSFGIVKVKDYTIDDIQIYDVYDADGQLTAHIEPPAPIKKYLNMPHWFLRDSNFSPDFLENYAKAKVFLEKELNLSDLSGAFLITTTAIENLLGAFGDIYLPDFNETISQRNFYLKAQIHAEKDFFPGSIQKKSFLASLTRQILINTENMSLKKLAQATKKSLDEKQIVIYFDDPKIQETINSFYWSGMVIEPKCSTQIPNCLTDYLFPYDANVGANKVNFFINRSISLKINIDSQGVIHHFLSIQLRNESPSEVFPGGIYRNYFQLLLPVRSTVKQVTRDGVLVEDYQEKLSATKTVGFFFEVKPKRTTEIKINYDLDDKLEKGQTAYQFIIQKQIGAPNTDFVAQITLANNIFLLNQNFSPLVKDNSIIYNTSLSADKIFFMELTKK